MIGHQQVIAARKAGYKPRAIFIDAGYEPPIWRRECDHPERELEQGFYPTVTITEADLRGHMDLRFVAGCRVHVCGRSWSNTLTDFADALAKAGAPWIAVWCSDGAGEILEWADGRWRAYAA